MSFPPSRKTSQTPVLAALLLVGLAISVRAAEKVTITPDVVYGHKFGLAMTFDVFTPNENRNGAGVLFMVSGGWYSKWAPPEKLAPRFAALTEKGFTVFAIRHGSSPKFSIPEAVSDVRRSVRFIRTHAERFGVDPDRLGVFGASAGGHLSLMLGTASDDGDPKTKDPVLRTSDRVKAVCAWVAPTDLRIMVPEAKDRLAAYQNYPALELEMGEAGKYSPLLHVSSDDAATLLIVGAKDKLVPMKHSEDIHAAFKEKEVTSELIVLQNADHGFKGVDLLRAVIAMTAWFEKHLAEN
jgi:acetyl esterase/lipase